MADAAPPSPASPARRVWLVIVLVQVMFGSLSVAGKFALRALPPEAVATVRVAAAAAVFVALAHALAPDTWLNVPRRHVLAFGAFSVLGVVVNQLLFVEGLARTTAINATLIVTTIPAWTLLIALLMGRERFAVGRAVGVALAFAGVALLLGVDAIRLGGENVLGNVLVATNAFSYSLFLVFSRPFVHTYGALVVTAWTFLLGTGLMLALTGWRLADTDYAAVPAEAWLALAWIVVVATVGAHGLANWSLRYLDSSQVAAFIPLQPLVATVLAVTLLGESLTLSVFGAGALIVAGVVTAARSTRSRRAGKPI